MKTRRVTYGTLNPEKNVYIGKSGIPWSVASINLGQTEQSADLERFDGYVIVRRNDMPFEELRQEVA